MATKALIWTDQADHGRNKVVHAQRQSELAFARVQGMKIAAELDPPKAAVGGFPYRSRTCAEWIHQEQRGRCPVKRRGRLTT